MGTTMVMASIQGNKITIAHIGDSRCYLLRPGYYDYEGITNTDKDNVVYQTNMSFPSFCTINSPAS